VYPPPHDEVRDILGGNKVTSWQKLVLHYSRGRKICNCREAYAGKVEGYQDGRRIQMWGCPNGCGANQIDAREFVAKKVIDEFNMNMEER